MEILDVIESIELCTRVMTELHAEYSFPDFEVAKATLLSIKKKLEKLKTQKETDSINLVFFQKVLKAIQDSLDMLYETTQDWKGPPEIQEDDKFWTDLKKLETLDEILIYAANGSKDDLLCLTVSDERWKKLNDIIMHHNYPKRSKTIKHYKTFFKRTASGWALMATGLKEKTNIEKKVMVGLGAIYFSIFQSEAIKQAELYSAKPRIDISQTTFNMIDSWMLSKLYNWVIPSIDVNKIYHVPRTVSSITSKEFHSYENDKDSYLAMNKHRVMMRLLRSKNNNSGIKFFGGFCFCAESRKGKKKQSKKPNKLIFHIHGGGYISMSSASHQVYTRKWANILKIPVISIDYRLAPAHPYPEGLDDVWQAYNWVINHAEEEYGITPEKIIVTGDSAGGNFALALTYKCILAGIKVPDGLILSYPSLRLDKNFFTPSLLLSLDDFLIPHTLMKLILENYLKDPSLDPANDIFISPIAVSDEMLKAMPPVRILVGDNDPLQDDCMRFAEKLLNVNGDVKLTIFQGTPHGALNLCFPGGVKESFDVLNQTIAWFEELFDNN